MSAGEGVGAYPGVAYGGAGGEAEAGEVGRQGPLQQIGAPAHSVLCLAHIQALGKEAGVVGCREAERNMANELTARPGLGN